jgi:Family of unknown function (DUF5941)
MTVALVLAAEPAAGLCGQLTSLGVRRVDGTEDAGPGAVLLTVAAAARATGEQMLICAGDLAVPRQALARLLGAERTAGYAEARPGCRAMLVDQSDLRALAEAAEYLASRPGEPDQVSALMGELARRGVTVEFVEARPDGDADRDEDGLVAEFFADPVARDVARWASERELAPAALLGISLGLGLVAAIWFAEPTATAKAVAAVTLLAAFVSSRAGRFLAAAPGPVLAAIGSFGGRVGARSSVIQPGGDWLSAAGWVITECAVYAGLAASSGLGGTSPAGTAAAGTSPGRFDIAAIGAGSSGVWHLAVAALAVLAVRRMTDLCYERATENTGGRTRLPRSAGRRIERALTLPAGERAVLVIVAGGIWGPRVAFLALIGWGVVATGYLLTARLVGLRDSAAYGGRSPSAAPAPADEGSISLDAAVPFGALGAMADARSGNGARPGNGAHPGNGDDSGYGARSRPGEDGEDEEDDPGSADEASAFSAVGLRPTGTAREPAARRAARPRPAARESMAGYQIAAYRDDGPISLWLGRLVEGRIPPVPPVLVGVFVTVALALLGMGNLSGVLVLTPAEAMLLAGLGSFHPHDGRLDWLVPPLIQVGEYLFLAALAFTRAVAPPLVFALIAAVVLRHLDVAYRARHRIRWPAARPGDRRGRKPARITGPDGRPADVTGLGWEVRMLVLGIGAALGVVPFACIALAGYLWALVIRDFLTGWLGVRDEAVPASQPVRSA